MALDTGALTGPLGVGEFVVASTGSSPLPDGGTGLFSIQIVNIPEPASGALWAWAGWASHWPIVGAAALAEPGFPPSSSVARPGHEGGR